MNKSSNLLNIEKTLNTLLNSYQITYNPQELLDEYLNIFFNQKPKTCLDEIISFLISEIGAKNLFDLIFENEEKYTKNHNNQIKQKMDYYLEEMYNSNSILKRSNNNNNLNSDSFSTNKIDSNNISKNSINSKNLEDENDYDYDSENDEDYVNSNKKSNNSNNNDKNKRFKHHLKNIKRKNKYKILEKIKVSNNCYIKNKGAIFPDENGIYYKYFKCSGMVTYGTYYRCSDIKCEGRGKYEGNYFNLYAKHNLNLEEHSYYDKENYKEKIKEFLENKE